MLVSTKRHGCSSGYWATDYVTEKQTLYIKVPTPGAILTRQSLVVGTRSARLNGAHTPADLYEGTAEETKFWSRDLC